MGLLRKCANKLHSELADLSTCFDEWADQWRELNYQVCTSCIPASPHAHLPPPTAFSPLLPHHLLLLDSLPLLTPHSRMAPHSQRELNKRKGREEQLAAELEEMTQLLEETRVGYEKRLPVQPPSLTSSVLLPPFLAFSHVPPFLPDGRYEKRLLAAADDKALALERQMAVLTGSAEEVAAAKAAQEKDAR